MDPSCKCCTRKMVDSAKNHKGGLLPVRYSALNQDKRKSRRRKSATKEKSIACSDGFDDEEDASSEICDWKSSAGRQASFHDRIPIGRSAVVRPSSVSSFQTIHRKKGTKFVLQKGEILQTGSGKRRVSKSSYRRRKSAQEIRRASFTSSESTSLNNLGPSTGWTLSPSSSVSHQMPLKGNRVPKSTKLYHPGDAESVEAITDLMDSVYVESVIPGGQEKVRSFKESTNSVSFVGKEEVYNIKSDTENINDQNMKDSSTVEDKKPTSSTSLVTEPEGEVANMETRIDKRNDQYRQRRKHKSTVTGTKQAPTGLVKYKEVNKELKVDHGNDQSSRDKSIVTYKKPASRRMVQDEVDDIKSNTNNRNDNDQTRKPKYEVKEKSCRRHKSELKEETAQTAVENLHHAMDSHMVRRQSSRSAEPLGASDNPMHNKTSGRRKSSLLRDAEEESFHYHEYDSKSIKVDPKPLVDYLMLVETCPSEFNDMNRRTLPRRRPVRSLLATGNAFSRRNCGLGNPDVLVAKAAYSLRPREYEGVKMPWKKEKGTKTVKVADLLVVKQEDTEVQEDPNATPLQAARKEVDRWMRRLSTAQLVKAKELAIKELGQEEHSLTKWWVAQRHCGYLRIPQQGKEDGWLQ